MEKNSNQPSEDQTSFRKCLWFDHYVIPYLGDYDSDNYDLQEPNKMIRHQDSNIISKYCPKMFQTFKKFIEQHPQTEVEIGQIHYTVSKLKTYEIKKRTNIVMHFLCMRDKDTAKNESYYLKSSIYAERKFLNLSITPTSPHSDTLVFNSDNLEDESNEVNIIFHDEEYLSPDNCAIYINHAYQYLTFGLLTAYKIHPDENYKLFAAIFFIDNTPLLLQSLPETQLEQFSAYHLLLSKRLSNLIDIKVKEDKSTQDLSKENNFFQAIQSFEGHFYEFLWTIFDRPQIADFGKNLYLNADLKSQVLFLLIFTHHLLTVSFQTFCAHARINDDHEQDFLGKTFDGQLETCEISEQIELILDCFMNENFSEAQNCIANLNPFFQSYLFERGWTLKGQRLDVPINYGEMIFLNLEGVDKEEDYLTIQEKIYILTSLKNKFDVNFYKDKIMFLP